MQPSVGQERGNRIAVAIGVAVVASTENGVCKKGVERSAEVFRPYRIRISLFLFVQYIINEMITHNTYEN